MTDDCIFCKIAAGDIPSEKVYGDEELYAFRDINPGAPSHILVIPRRHIPSVTDAGPEDAELLGKMMLRANAIAAEEGLVDKGFRYVLNCGEWGGQTVFHIHLHVLGGRPLAWPPG